MEEAYRRVKANRGKPGVDGISFDDIEEQGLSEYLKDLHFELKERRYKPSPVLRVYIPKPNGDKRPLGIPTIRDRIVQTCFKLVLEPIFEPDFMDSSYGFRPKRSAHGAIKEIAKLLNWGCTDIYDVDLSKYFDTVDHSKLMSLISERVVDKMILKVIREWLDCGYVEDDQHYTPKQGTPQGGVISPLLANIYLNPMDKAMERSKLWWKNKGSVHIIRYADDFLIMARNNLEYGKQIVHSNLKTLGLKINEDKTSQFSMAESGTLEYLGFRFTRTVNRKNGNKFFLLAPSPKSMNSIREKVRGIVNTKIPITIKDQVQRVNTVLDGWTNYYRLGNASDSFNKLRNFVNKRVRRVLQRRKGKAGFGYNRYDSNYIYGKLGLKFEYKAIPV